MIKEYFIELITALILVIRNFVFLIIFPYKTMRRLSFQFDYYQTAIIFFGVFIYFKFAYFLKDKPYPATLVFSIFVINFFLTTGFFYLLSKIIFKKRLPFLNFVYTFSYTLFPTLIWFGLTSFLYIILPPPRTMSIFGQGFSVLFVSFSLTLLAWKLILVFLSLRFSLRLSFYQIIYSWLLFFTWFLPYVFLLYYFRIFRVPFI